MNKKTELLFYFLAFNFLILTGQYQDYPAQVISLSPLDESFSINESVYLIEDKEAGLTFEDIGTPEFTARFIKSAKKKLNFGFNQSAFWVKLHIKNLEPEINDWQLEIEDEHIDSIDFFYLSRENKWERRQYGEMYPFSQREWESRTFIIPLQLPDTITRTFYFRLRTQGTLHFDMNIYRERACFSKVIQTDTYYGIFFGIMFLLIIYNIFIYLSLRDISYFYYILLVLSSLGFIALESGHMFQYVLQNSMRLNIKLLPISIPVCEFCFLLFTISFLNVRKYSMVIYRILISIMALAVILVILLSIINYHQAIQIAAYSSQIYIVITLISGIVCYLRGNKGARMFVLGFTMYFIGALAISFLAMGIVRDNFVTVHGMELGSILNGVILSLALIDNYRISKIEKEKAQEEIIRMRERASEVLEHMVSDRTKEIHDKNEELELQQEELKTINDILENQKEELQKTLENLKQTQAQLVQSEKMASIGQLVAGIAHEINNPVTFISAGVDSLRTNLEEVSQVLEIYHRITTSNVTEKLKEIEKLKEKVDYNEALREINKLIESVKTGSERTSEIVKGLRTFSRLDEDVLKVANIHEGLDSTLILLHNKYKERIGIEKNYGDIPDIECYPGQLNQVFMNILSNAIDAIENKGTITISTAKSNGKVQINIRDSGKGIPEKIRNKIFEPFFTTKEVGHGTGLGLSISHGIIEKHNGTIKVISEIGKGSEFIISLPIKQGKE
jgi:two-component system NtrC family sensor kinase